MNSGTDRSKSSPTEPGDGDASDFWIQRGKNGSSPLSVTPGATDEARVAWSRAKLQGWTLDRLKRHARFDHYVDIGCGFGDFTVALGREARAITACDVSPEFVAATRQRLTDAGCKNARVTVSDARTFVDYDNASIIYLGGVLMYLDREGVLEVLEHARERLAPDGIIAQRDWCAVMFGREQTNRHPWFSVHRRPSTCVDLFHAAGFELIEQAPSMVMYPEQIGRELLRNETAVKVASFVPKLFTRAVMLGLTRCSVTFLYRRAGTKSTAARRADQQR